MGCDMLGIAKSMGRLSDVLLGATRVNNYTVYFVEESRCYSYVVQRNGERVTQGFMAGTGLPLFKDYKKEVVMNLDYCD